MDGIVERRLWKPRGLTNGVSWTLTKYRLTDGNPKPLCMIPFGVSMSDVKAGKFSRAHEPVFVYLPDGKMLSGIRIRLLVSIRRVVIVVPSSLAKLLSDRGNVVG